MWLLCCVLLGPFMWLELIGISIGTRWMEMHSLGCLAAGVHVNLGYFEFPPMDSYNIVS